MQVIVSVQCCCVWFDFFLAIVTYLLKNLAGSLYCSVIPIVVYIESIIKAQECKDISYKTQI